MNAVLEILDNATPSQTPIRYSGHYYSKLEKKVLGFTKKSRETKPRKARRVKPPHKQWS